ncbi:dihydroceramidase [Marchantia polymorpha subsp. ruderalis]|uniref:Alkaline phytoceramidase n=1 Tax=Marchantia polymorpha TaxID=3197 RepID=A0A2R6XAR2_MARPO|nr:hypothetical protein MARPO_0026s0076 [Marchantia polymorpha]BBN02119.1 hypothetical protein Mp_2g12960 [Marchantia polymorpha subsp. ruderalis]|eukprot:PTQ43201.1 hypothetical protein MARPO_0026s0076 [Marchantia polymorpha]
MAGYWGPVTASTEWCEKNYEISHYVGEFFNTISNVPMILLALIGLCSTIGQSFEKRFSVLHLSSIVIGIGSILFHASLKYGQQQSDETPMVWLMLLYIYVLYSPDWHYRSTMPTFLFIYGTAYAICHALFHFVLVYQLHFIFLCLLCLPRMYKYYIYTTEVPARRLGHMYLISITLGGICWLVDRNLCSRVASLPVNPQGHAWWHVFMGFSAYFGNTFLQFCRAQQLEWNPELRYVGGWLPFVKIVKPKTH